MLGNGRLETLCFDGTKRLVRISVLLPPQFRATNRRLYRVTFAAS